MSAQQCKHELHSRLTTAEQRLKWAEDLLERAKVFMVAIQIIKWLVPDKHSVFQWLSDYEKGPVNEN